MPFFPELEFLDDRFDGGGERTLRALRNSNQLLYRSLLTWQESSMTDEERTFANGMLPTGLLADVPEPERCVALALARRIAQRTYQRNLRRRFAPYDHAQPLFVAVPSLLSAVRRSGNRSPDLLAASALDSVPRETRVVAIKSHFGTVDWALPQQALQVVMDSAPRSPLFLRLDPELVFAEAPLEPVNEEMIRPIDPHWWEEFRIYRGEPTGLALILQPPANPKDDLERYWDYHIRGIRKLEMSVIRRGGNYVTVMIEELELNATGLMGYCVHTDAFVEQGTPIASCLANHLDLSVNWYEGANVERRMATRLDFQQKTDADIHTHLLRVENAPFSLLFSSVASFFRSPTLIREWRAAQNLAS